jgi:hypothetical protein
MASIRYSGLCRRQDNVGLGGDIRLRWQRVHAEIQHVDTAIVPSQLADFAAESEVMAVAAADCR